MILRTLLCAIGLLFYCVDASAFGLRLLGTGTSTEAKDMNDFLRSVGLTEIQRLPGLTLEANTGAADAVPFEVGVRYSAHRLQVGVAGDATESDFTRLTVWEFPVILRVYVLDQRYFRFDIFGGGGPSWASLETRKGGIESTYELAKGDLRFMTLAAGSLQFGYEYAYLVIEGGYQWNKVGSLTRTFQPAPSAMNTLDISGAFVTVGAAFRVGGPSGGLMYPRGIGAKATTAVAPH